MGEKNTERDLVYTLKNRCRVCYTCVRECPAKAIRIVNGQAEIINERCIVCGNCTKVCSQGAKVYLNTTEHIKRILQSRQKTVAIVAPSFPAEFEEIADHERFVGMVKELGFDMVSEVAFGADLVAAEYSKILKNSKKHYISSDCPAIVSFIEKYYPSLVNSLAPIASPMVAMSRVMHEKYGKDIKVVFIGPCVAKKSESDEVDEMMTFKELRNLFEELKIDADKIEPVEFDPPLGGKGAIFPVSRGLLQTADINDDVIEGSVIVAEGRADFQEAIKEFKDGYIDTHNLELLCCEGCIMGAGMSTGGRQYARRILVNNYVQQKIKSLNNEEWQAEMEKYKSLNLSADFKEEDHEETEPASEQVNRVLESMGKTELKDHLNCGACGYDSCEEHAEAIVQGLAEIEMCLPYSIEKLHKSVDELAVSNEKLKTMQQALKQSEKMASMGQLSAGIAHELNNPLGVVVMYANIIMEEAPGNTRLYKDLQLIVEQTNRCKKIVGGLLNFARKNQVNYTYVDAVKLVEESLDAILIPEQVAVSVEDNNLHEKTVELDHEQMLQTLTNIIKNACDAMSKGGRLDIKLWDDTGHTYFNIKDEGKGIPEADREKIFEPFYTTKGIGKGTGLGLATAYGIVKMHKGKINVESNTDPEKGDVGTTFEISIPKNK